MRVRGHTRALATASAVCIAMAALPAAAAQAAAYPGDAYVAYLGGPLHTSANLTATAITPANAAALTQAWTVPGVFVATPAVANGMVYAGSNNGTLYALNEGTGKVVWKRFLGKVTKTTCGSRGITSTSTVATDPQTGELRVYDAGGNGYLFALSAATGAVRWKSAVAVASTTVNDYYQWSSPTVAGGKVYIGISSQCDTPLVRGGIKAFDQSTGALLATHYTVPAGAIGGSVWSSAAVTANSVFITTGNGPPKSANPGESQSIIRLDPATLARTDIWTVPSSAQISDGDFGGSPILFTATIGGAKVSMIGACNKNGEYYALRSAALSAGPVWTDQIGDRWQPSTDRQCLAAGILDRTSLSLYLASNQNTTLAISGSVMQVDPATGAVIWRTPLPAAIEGTPSLNGSGVIAAASYDATTSANAAWLIDASDGTILRTFQTNALDFAQPVFAGRYLFLANLKGLTAYQAP
jgi:polyvinyl alcohol dehydrogenase (cytochrome)